MSKATFWQRGETLDYKNTGTSTIEANSIIALKNKIAIAGMTIKPGEVGSIHVTGVFEFEKTGTAAIELGQTVYFDGTGITNAASGATVAGFAAAAAGAADTAILVKINA